MTILGFPGMLMRFAMLATAMLLLALPLTARAEGRVALVIGNSDYQHVDRLPNPVNDAEAIRDTFARLDFQVTLKTDLGKAALEQELADFSDKASGADIAVVFYAGHGMEMNGENYLIPVDARLRSDNRVKFETVSLNDILSSIEGVKGLKLVLLDACRNNPFSAGMKRSLVTRSIGRGLAKVETNPGVLVSYAAAAGTTAEDGNEKHSPYTTALLDHLEKPGLELSLMFRQIADQVQQRTEGRQTPFEYGRLPGFSIYLRSPVEQAALKPLTADPQPDPCRDAGLHWAAIDDKAERALFEDHLKRFGTCAFATLAKNALDRMDATTTVQTPVAIRPVTLGSGKADLAQADLAQAAADGAAIIVPVPDSGNGANTPATEVAALDATADPAALPADTVIEPPEDAAIIVRGIQAELRRVGCTASGPDGKWGPRSQGALERFIRAGKKTVASLSPSRDILDILKQSTGRVCPLDCGVRQIVKNGQCVAKTCAAGQTLSAKGQCIRDVRETRPASKSKSVNKAKPARKQATVAENRTTKDTRTVERAIQPKTAGSQNRANKADPFGRKCQSIRFCFEADH